jgi:O-antigen ligase
VAALSAPARRSVGRLGAGVLAWAWVAGRGVGWNHVAVPALALALVVLAVGRPRRPASREAWTWLAFAGWYVVAAVGSQHPGLSARAAAELLAVGALIAALSSSPRSWRLHEAIRFGAALGAITLLAWWSVHLLGWRGRGIAEDFLGASPSSVAARLGVALLIVRSASAPLPLQGAIAVGIGATTARAHTISVLAALVLGPPRRWTRAVAALLLLSFALAFASPWWSDRRHRVTEPTALAATSGRTAIWSLALQAVAEHPLRGSGPDTFAADYDRRLGDALTRGHPRTDGAMETHSVVLEILVDGGAIALLLLLAAVAQTARRLLGQPGSTPRAGLVFLLLSGLTVDLFVKGHFALLAAVVATLPPEEPDVA